MHKHIAILPGSFDPPTIGHQNLIERASKLCDYLYIGVAYAYHKSTLFSLEERAHLIENILPDLSLSCPVEIVTYNNLLVDLCNKLKIQSVIRGLRDSKDAQYEIHLANMNHYLNHYLDTLLLPTRPEFNFISSTFVREIARLGGDISQFVHKHVAKELLHKVR